VAASATRSWRFGWLSRRRRHGATDAPHEGSYPHGVDVEADGNGLLDDDRLYQLVRQPGCVRERTSEIAFREPGVEAYVFTFG
jgi:hypothetical protein